MFDRISNISILEWCMMEAIIFIGVWLWDPYIGKLVSFIFSPIFLGIVTISFIADRLDPSKISSKYYITLFLLGIIPIVIMILHKLLERFL